MNEYTYCLDCDSTVPTEHINDYGICEFADIREVLTEAKELNESGQ